jgi:hypothetical protein
MLTSGVRLAIMAILAYFGPVDFWRSMLLSISIHWFIFPILYNRLIIMKAWDYVGTTALLDRAEQWIRARLGIPTIFFLKFCFIAIGVSCYVTEGNPFSY